MLGGREGADDIARGAPRLAVVGGGWAGLAAAVEACRAGHRVTLFEMAPQLGGRARRVRTPGGLTLDNGQHILIGAYRETLALMRSVGVVPERVFLRRPLALVDPGGNGLRLGSGPPMLAFVRAVLGRRGWSLVDRLGLLRVAAGWALHRFRCDPAASVDDLTQGLSLAVRRTLIDPLCVAALNTPADRASGQVFLRVLRDALFSGRGSADLLLPRTDLSALLPDAAASWLTEKGGEVRLSARVRRLSRAGSGWSLDDEPFDRVILACSASEAAHLSADCAPEWAAIAAAFEYEPIITVLLHSRGTRLAQPMTVLASGDAAPAQFVFDLGAIDGGGVRDGWFSFVVSGARTWSARGLDATAEAILLQARSAFPAATWHTAPTVLSTLAERRATFLCTPGLHRPPAAIAQGLQAAGDYLAGPYPATLEGAVRSGLAAARTLDSGNVPTAPLALRMAAPEARR